jgi:hypothetical protein
VCGKLAEIGWRKMDRKCLHETHAENQRNADFAMDRDFELPETREREYDEANVEEAIEYCNDEVAQYNISADTIFHMAPEEIKRTADGGEFDDDCE